VKVPAFHSARAADVYHDRDDCPQGREIAERDRVEGTGGRQLCFHCGRTTSLENARNVKER
jgi:hypothetical protein